MIFLSRAEPTRRSGKEACLSIIGFFIAIGIIVGIAGLIFGNKNLRLVCFFNLFVLLGLVKNYTSATIAGGVVLGVSIFLTILFILTLGSCLKK